MKVMVHRAMGPALSNEEGDHNATRSASNSSSTNASPEIITVSYSASRASPRSANSGCRFALCSRPRLLPFLFTVASSSWTNPIFRSGEDCRPFNFNSLQASPMARSADAQEGIAAFPASDCRNSAAAE
jgi:hypothetical protein